MPQGINGVSAWNPLGIFGFRETSALGGEPMCMPLSEFASPLERERYRDRLRWRRHGAAVAYLIVSLPSMVLGGMVVARLGGMLGQREMIVCLAVWLLLGVAVLFLGRSVESVRLDVKAHRWTAEQAARLIPAWREVTAAAGVSEADYLAMIGESDEVRGCARTGRTVEVSNGAVLVLPRAQLRAMLAHELGHLLSSRHRRWEFVFGWYAMPLHLAPMLVSAVAGFPAGSPRRDGLLPRLMIAIAQVVYLYAMAELLTHLLSLRCALLAAALLTTQSLAKRLCRRRDERMADLIAVDLGFGIGLVEYLRQYDRGAYPWYPEHPEWDRLIRLIVAPMSTHPAYHTRIRTIESRISALTRNETVSRS